MITWTVYEVISLQPKFRKGVLLSAELGEDNEGTNYALRLAREKEPSWFARMLGKGPPSYTLTLPIAMRPAQEFCRTCDTGALAGSRLRSRNPQITFWVSSKCCGPSWASTWAA